MDTSEKQKLIRSLIVPGILVGIMWLIRFFEYWTGTDLSVYGLYPQHVEGLRGILFSPFLHSGFPHLSANSVPFFLLASGLFYFYDKKAIWIFILLWITTGFWVWVFAKDTGIHIGASGIVYALAAFHFTGGLIRREPKMMAFSLLVVFLYGGLIWGVIPDFLPEKNISWESHLMGLLAGLIIAAFYRNDGPSRKVYEWEEEDEDEPDEEPPALPQQPGGEASDVKDEPESKDDPMKFIYHIRKNPPTE